MEEGSYTHILRALQSLPRLNFVDFSTNFITGWYKAEELYVWYSANGLEVTNLILGAENGKKMAEELGMVITRQLETGAA